MRHRQTLQADYRLKTFEAETKKAFGFLIERGFTPNVELPEDTNR